MPVSHRYKNFGKPKPASGAEEQSDSEALEDLKLQSFEAGYQAGWDDSIKAQADDKSRISAELAQNLQAMSFTYHEALTKLTGSMEPVMKEVIEKLLPELVQQAMSAHIMEQLKKMMSEQVDYPIEIVVSDANVEAVNALAGSSITKPFQVIGEASLGEGQAFVRVGHNERQVDLDTIVTGVSEAMKAFFHEAGEGLENE